ncbi:hypothetical protein F9278_36360 [Streptomyces phaeolivaceus]|uniref:Uncharacterized protein n=1 Tax=Streptomyces phaeolivaceus TaxID=2653200 RepID=A0A5P8KCK0_9ACTN|nr:hypothetical protein [Streptomyces phaeolivaceus]QFR00751.1 hypothetical protein F9278_36360 [Streptomyces phaeolivaceus]
MTGTVQRLTLLPHLPYGDAVHIVLGRAGLVPDVLEAGLRVEDPKRGPELFLTLSWLPQHPDLTDPAGLDLLWSHLTGWSARSGPDVRRLLVSAFAAPPVLADAALTLLTGGLGAPWQPATVLHEWEDGRALDLALNSAAEQGLIAW